VKALRRKFVTKIIADKTNAASIALDLKNFEVLIIILSIRKKILRKEKFKKILRY